MTNGTCEVKQGGLCFAVVREEYDNETGTFEPEYTYGCLPPDEEGLLQVNIYSGPHYVLPVRLFSSYVTL